ncbi:translation initiation factor IF-2-like [Eriocheir sinensis]|uniref:translation initiation factor IF-2-like n=1 Tax=Eriocheir sinensis TaxID=95602 RepID=UPI0021C5CC74|nr:translation initiation factor IF-2-like [Eriocheir sinensis]
MFVVRPHSPQPVAAARSPVHSPSPLITSSSQSTAPNPPRPAPADLSPHPECWGLHGVLVLRGLRRLAGVGLRPLASWPRLWPLPPTPQRPPTPASGRHTCQRPPTPSNDRHTRQRPPTPAHAHSIVAVYETPATPSPWPGRRGAAGAGPRRGRPGSGHVYQQLTA